MIYDELLGKYIDENGKIVDSIPVVNVDNGVNFGRDFEVEEILGQDVIFKEEQQKAITIEKALTNFKIQVKALEEQKKEINTKLLQKMQDNNIWKIELNGVTITRCKEYERKTIDNERLKNEMPDIAKLYEKTSNVGETIKIKIGGTDNGV